MPNVSASLFLGIIFVIIGAVNVWLILQASAQVKNTRASARLIAAHRIGGYIFISLFCVMGYFMIARMRDSSGTASTGTMIHLTVTMLLSPLLFVKVLIARYYKSYYAFLTPYCPKTRTRVMLCNSGVSVQVRLAVSEDLLATK